MIFLDRGRRGEDPYLGWKVKLFLAGAGVALLGMARGSSWLVSGGMVILLLGVLLRFLPARRGGEASPEDGDDGDEPAAGGESRTL